MRIYKVIAERKKTGKKTEISFFASNEDIALRIAKVAFDRRKYKIITFYSTETIGEDHE